MNENTNFEENQREVESLREKHQQIKQELSKVIIGQTEVINTIMISLFTELHSLIIGVPGLAKTLMISTLAKILNLSFKRIQFTPDLMPSDITGTDIIRENKQTGERDIVFIQGPVFANLILADEINRTPPKTQSALLQAMQEKEVTVGNETFSLPRPFLILATQNPIEQEGTYPLSEAQLDRFMFSIHIDYPSKEEELQIVSETTENKKIELHPVMDREDITKFQKIIKDIPISHDVLEYAVNLSCCSRPSFKEAPDFIKEFVLWGAGPRASQFMVLGAKARALLQGRYNVALEDIKAVAKPVLRHRILINYAGETENIRPDNIIQKLMDHLKKKR